MFASRSLVLLLCLAAIVPTVAAGAPCESLLAFQLRHTTIMAARIVGAGSFVLPADAPPASSDFFSDFSKLREFCRVEGVIRPSRDSHIEFEVWLPSDWNGKYVGAGNGGFSGSINYYRMAEAVNAGYAASSTDVGHKGGSGDMTWAVGHPEQVVDFEHRAIHETALKSKALIEGFYSRPPQRSYFNSCSNGGRQGLTEAVMYPSDYDGILAGAPGITMVWQYDERGHFTRERHTRNLVDLSVFKNRGGKLILYHGSNDGPQSTVDYYNALIAKFGRRALEEFVMLFVVPEMGHCGGGPVPDFGTRLWPLRDAGHSISLALERWVEQGVRPGSVTATKFKVDGDPASGVVRTRPLCAYPQEARWDGIGNEDVAASYRCVVSPSP